MRASLVLVSSLVVAVGCSSSAGVTSDKGGSSGRGGAGSTATGSGGTGTTSGSGGQPATGSGTGGAGQQGSTGGAGASSGGGAGHAGGGGGTSTGGGAGHAAGSGGASSGGASGSNGGPGGHVGAGTGGAATGSGGAGNHGTGGNGGASGHGTGGAGNGTGGAGGGIIGGGSGGAAGAAGNPDASCSAGVPAAGQPASVANPTTVVGTGSADSCTLSALKAAVTKAGVITFDCGTDPVTIAVTATLNLSTTKDTVIDGGNKVTLDGGHAVQILNYDSPDFQATETRVTLQHLTLVNGKTTPTDAIPPAPEPACSQGFDDGEGGALYMRDGNLTVIDCTFSGNQAAPLGPDTGGGAIYIVGSKHGALIVGSTFTDNSGANAGAIGSLFAELDIYNSLFANNVATGHDANNVDDSMCSVMNNGANEIGSGGNGGAIYGDGNSFNITLCGDAVLNNAAGQNAFGGGLFFTSDNFAGVLTITDTTMAGNTGGHWTSVKSGSVTNAGSAVGVNAQSIVVTNSKLQN